MLVCALGDLTVDVIVRLDGPIAAGSDTSSEIRLAAGGQAANIAAWSSTLGAEARYIGKRGADDAAHFARARLETYGVEVHGPEEGRGGVICSLVDRDGERSMLSDRGAAPAFRADELDARWLDGCDHLFVSGYALFADPARDAARAAIAVARESGACVSVDLSSWSGIEASGADELRVLVAELAPNLVFTNEDEDRVIGGALPGIPWILKRGARGCSFDGDERAALPVERVVDSTGAGDALAAGFIVGGPDLALEAAARCVAGLGSMP